MAVVYRAHDLMLERTVAIKILREDFSQDEAFSGTLQTRSQSCSQPCHTPNIVTVHDFGLDAGRLFIVMGIRSRY